MTTHSFYNLPNYLTLLRLPLAALVWLFPSRSKHVLGVMLFAGFTDVLDGWVARKLKLKNSYGKWLDPLCDKIFVLSTLIAVVSANRFSIRMALLIATRELIQAPLMMLYLIPSLRPAFPINFESTIFGKMTTCLQFGALTSILFQRRTSVAFAKTSAIAGFIASSTYIHRVFDAQRFRLWHR